MPEIDRSKNCQIYYKFRAKSKENDELVEYRIQDLPEKLYDKALEMYLKEFVPYEVMCSSRGVPNNPEAMEDIANFWREAMNERLILACFRSDDIENQEIVAVNILYRCSIEHKDDKFELKQQDIKDIINLMEYSFKQCNIFEKYGVDEFVGALGLVVNYNYRNRGIAIEMLKARKPLLESLGLQLTSTAFTGIGSQKAAKYAGYEEDFSEFYVNLAKVSPNFDFTKDPKIPFKIMSLKL